MCYLGHYSWLERNFGSAGHISHEKDLLVRALGKLWGLLCGRVGLRMRIRRVEGIFIKFADLNSKVNVLLAQYRGITVGITGAG